MYLVDIRDKVDVARSLDALAVEVSELCSSIYNQMDEEESLWIFAPSEAMGTEYWPVGMAVADEIREQSPFTLKNVITRYTDPLAKRNFTNTHEEILLLVKNKQEYYFDKDSIRIEHVYEGNEWGDRAEGTSAYHDSEVRRYNPGGKDPGNVWLTENRTETPDETVDHTEPLPRDKAVLRCVRAGSKEDEVVHMIGFDDTVKEVVQNVRKEHQQHFSHGMLEGCN